MLSIIDHKETPGDHGVDFQMFWGKSDLRLTPKPIITLSKMLSGHALQMTPGGEDTELSPVCLPVHNWKETGLFAEDRGADWYTRKCGSLSFFYINLAQVKKLLTTEIKSSRSLETTPCGQ